MKFLILLPLLGGLAVAAPGKEKQPCPYKNTVTVTKTSYTSTLTITSTKGASTTTTETDTITVTDTSTASTTTSVVATSLVTSCAAPTGPSKRSPGPKKQPAPKYCLQASTTTTTESAVSLTTTTVTTTGTATATVVTTSTTTTTTTATSTATTSTTTIAAIPTFVVYVQGGDKDGAYFSLSDGSPPVIRDNGNLANSASFSILPDGSFAVADDGKIAEEDPSRLTGEPYLVYAEGPTDIATNGPNAQTITCSIGVNSDGTCPLNCATSGGYTISYDCGASWRLAPSVPATCYQFTPYVVGETTPDALATLTNSVGGVVEGS